MYSDRVRTIAEIEIDLLYKLYNLNINYLFYIIKNQILKKIIAKMI